MVQMVQQVRLDLQVLLGQLVLQVLLELTALLVQLDLQVHLEQVLQRCLVS
jgi:hypothetical protein